MTKIDGGTSNSTQDIDSLESGDGTPSVEAGLSESADTVAETPRAMKDEVVEDEAGFFESLGAKADEFIDSAADAADEILPSFKPHELVELGTGPVVHPAVDEGAKPLIEALPRVLDDLPSIDETGIGPFAAEEFDVLDHEIPTASEVIQATRDFAKTLDLPAELEMVPKAIILDAADAAEAAHEKYVQRGESPLQYLRNVPGAADRVMDNVNDAMKDVFGDDAQQFTLDPSIDDIKYTVGQLLNPNSKTRKQAKTAILLGAFEVLRENAGVIRTAADTRTARAVSEVLEDTVDFAAAAAVMGAGSFFGIAGLAGGGLIAKKIVTDELELPFPGADDISEFMTDIQSNPTEYRRKITVASGPFAGNLESLEPGQTYSSWTTLKLSAGKGVVGKGSATAKAVSQKLDDETYKVDIRVGVGAGVGIGAKLQELGFAVSAGMDRGVSASLIFKGPNAARAAAAVMRGELGAAVLTGGLPGVEAIGVDARNKLSATANDVLNASTGVGVSLRANPDKVVGSAEIGGEAGLSVAQKFLSLKGIGDREGATKTSEILAELSGPSLSVDTNAAAKFSVEANEDGSLQGVFELDVGIARDDIELRANVTARVTDLKKLLDANGLTREQLLHLAENEPERLVVMLSEGDFGVELEAKTQVRDLDSASIDLSIYERGGAWASDWRDIEDDTQKVLERFEKA